jgi:pyruvate,water dikinase
MFCHALYSAAGAPSSKSDAPRLVFLNLRAPGLYDSNRLEEAFLRSLGFSAPAMPGSLVVDFGSASACLAASAGGKGASLSRMAQAALPVPPGFIVCAAAFNDFLNRGGAFEQVQALAGTLDVHDAAALEVASARLRELVLSAPLPADLRTEVSERYEAMGGPDAAVAVRSSACSEDGEAASFAGQQETFLNVRGAAQVLDRMQHCWASFFTPRALFYRAQKGDLTDAGIAVVVQEMIAAEKSGVAFTADPVQRRRDRLVIEAAFGLGEAVVSGTVTPDHYLIDRKNGAVMREFIQGERRVLEAAELDRLRELAERLEAFFGKPQDIEWSIRDGEIFLLQSRPITTL